MTAEITTASEDEIRELKRNTVSANGPRSKVHAINDAQNSIQSGLQTPKEELKYPEVGSKYAGDIKDEEAPITNEGYQTIDFENPAELAAFFDPYINTGEITLHKWQTDLQESLGAAAASSLHPHKFILCAANGSGKDAFIVAPFVVWHALCKRRSLTIITSSSGVQLTAQTENYIRTLCRRVNKFYQEIYGCEIFKINQRFIRCRLSGSEIRLFATDEEGKAEGYHPLEPNASFAIVINEAKSVSKEIYQALRRCTGFSYWLEVSTPGEPHGDFYKHFTYWPNKLRITFYDCPHQSPEEFEADKLELGEASYLFRSKWLALFTSVGGQVVVTDESLSKCINNNVKPICQDWPLRIGIDISLGGDETVLQFVKGNVQKKQVTFRITESIAVADRIEDELEEMQIKKDHDYIFADDGGIGRAIIDILVRRGWNIHRVLNQSKARRKQGQFRNRGAELWFKFSRLVTECIVILLPDEKLHTQLTNRHYKKADGLGGITLMSKAEEKSEGRNSPDRADALILAFADVDYTAFVNYQEQHRKKAHRQYLGKDWAEIEENYENLDHKIKQLKSQLRAKGSLQVLMNSNRQPSSNIPIIDI